QILFRGARIIEQPRLLFAALFEFSKIGKRLFGTTKRSNRYMRCVDQSPKRIGPGCDAASQIMVQPLVELPAVQRLFRDDTVFQFLIAAFPPPVVEGQLAGNNTDLVSRQ